VRQMLAVGIPAAGGLFFEGGAFAAATVMMGWLGAVPLAAHQIAITCAALTFMISLGIAMALGMRTSAAVGAGEHARLRPLWIGGTLMGLVISLGFTAVFLVFGRSIAGMFISDPHVIPIATVLLGVAAVFQIFDGGQVIHSCALRGLTDVKVPALITFTAYWVIALPAGYLLGVRWGFGGAGIWTGLAAGLAFAAFVLGARFVRLSRVGGQTVA